MLRSLTKTLLTYGKDLSGLPLTERRHFQLVALAGWVNMGANGAFALRAWLDGNPVMWANLFAGTAAALAAVGMARGLHHRVAATVGVYAVAISLIAAVIMAGGPFTPDVVWLVVIPQCGVLLGGVRLGIASAVVTVGAYLTMHAVAPLGVWSPPMSGHDDWFVEVLGVLLVTIIMNLVFMENQRAGDRRYERAVQELEVEVAERRAAEARAMAGERAKTAFLATLSHEIRTPLNGVLGMADLLADRPLADEDADAVRTIRSSGTTLLTLLNDVLELSRLEAGRLPLVPSPVALAPLLRDTHRLFAGSVKPGVALRTDFGDDLPEWLQADGARLRQVLNNLVGNAVKFTERGEIVLRAEREGDRLRLSVRDTGIGMSAEALTSIFEPFQQAEASTHARYGGTGLGLAIVHRLIEAMDGCVDVRSVEGEGTTFILDLPLLPVEAPAATRANTAPVVHGDRLEILVVDDNPVNRKVADGLLRRQGHAPTLAESGAVALELLSHTPFDVVLLDISMPDMDGHEVLARIRADATLAGQVVIALTAHAMAGDAEAFVAEGFDHYLAKPLRPEELARALSIERRAA